MPKLTISANKRPQVVAASEFKFAGSNERAVGRNGELNASSKLDLLKRGQIFMQATAHGEVATDADVLAREENKKIHAALVQAAFNDPQQHRILGERIVESLQITANRQGFTRKFLAKINPAQGSTIRFPMRLKNVTAVWATGPTQVGTQITRDNWYTPPELQIIARPYITQNELNQSAGDVLEEKRNEALEGVMVAEDRLLYNLAEQTIGIDNDVSIISGQLTPYTMAQVRQNVTRWGLKVPYVLMASDLTNDIIGNSDFHSALDPVARHELLMTGELGVMWGMTVVSDAYRHPEHKVLNQGEFFVFADKENLGAYADRDSLISTPTDITTERVAGRGWVISESFAIQVANSRAIAKGIRI